jgi:hypothetical protein
MYIITIDGREDEGAYSVSDESGVNILYIFDEEDDSVRFAMLLEEDNYPKMSVMEVSDELILKACELHGYTYQVFTSDDIVIPPSKENTDFI